MLDKNRKAIVQRTLALVANEESPSGVFFSRLVRDGLVESPEEVLGIVTNYFQVRGYENMGDGIWTIDIDSQPLRNYDILIRDATNILVECSDAVQCDIYRDEVQRLFEKWQAARAANNILMLTWHVPEPAYA